MIMRGAEDDARFPSMKSIKRCGVIFLAQLMLAAIAFADDAAMKQSALEFQSARFKAMIEEDIESLEDYLADDLTYTHTTGRTESKSDFLSTIESREIDYISVVPRNVEVRIYGDLAVMTGLAEIHGALRDKEVSFTMRFLDVSRRADDSWQLVAWQSVRIPEDNND